MATARATAYGALHSLPLEKGAIFEVAYAPACGHIRGMWDRERLPASDEWSGISPERMTDVVQCNLDQINHLGLRNAKMTGICRFNHGTGSAMGLRRYHYVDEQNGIYHFKHCNREHPDIIVREVASMVLELHLSGSTITVTNMAGTTVFRHEGQPGESLRLFELRSMIHRKLIADELATSQSPLKLMRATRGPFQSSPTVLRGNVLLLRADRVPRSHHVQRRARGQAVITQFLT